MFFFFFFFFLFIFCFFFSVEEEEEDNEQDDSKEGSPVESKKIQHYTDISSIEASKRRKVSNFYEL